MTNKKLNEIAEEILDELIEDYFPFYDHVENILRFSETPTEKQQDKYTEIVDDIATIIKAKIATKIKL